MAQINLMLASDDAVRIEDQVDEALAGLLAADGPNLVPAGRRKVDAALTEVAWIDDEDSRNHVSLMLDTDMPAQWLAVTAHDEATIEEIAQALRDGVDVRGYDDLLGEAESGAGGRGALSRLALTHDARLAAEFPVLLERALSSAEATRREDAVMAAHLVGDRAQVPALKRALTRETDSGIKAMLEHTIQTLEGAPP